MKRRASFPSTHHPNTNANTKGATMVASDSMTNLGVSGRSLSPNSKGLRRGAFRARLLFRAVFWGALVRRHRADCDPSRREDDFRVERIGQT